MERFLHVNHITICIDDSGDIDKEPLFLYHGLVESKEKMYSIREMFKDQYRVITVDARGHGGSTRPNQYTLTDHVQDFHQLVHQLGFKKVNLLGYSMGSYIALAAAEEDCHDIDHLVLVCTKPAGKTSSIAHLMATAGYDLATATKEQIKQVITKATYAPASFDHLTEIKARRHLARAKEPLTAPQKAAENASITGFDNSTALDKVTCKTLVIAAEYDGINKPAWGKKVAQGVPGAQYIEIKNAGHAVPFEQPSKFHRVVEQFLKH